MEPLEITEKTKELIAPYLDENGIELVEITYKRESGGMTLRLLVDTRKGIRITECEALNARLSAIIDKEGFIGEHYVIEVSSPGLDRPIKTDEDFMRSIGKELEASTYGPIDGRRMHVGVLIGTGEGKIVLESDGVSTVIPRDKIAVARLHIEF